MRKDLHAPWNTSNESMHMELVFVGGSVVNHVNSKLCASILIKLGL